MNIKTFLCGIVLASLMLLCIGKTVSAEIIIRVNPLKTIENKPHYIDAFEISDVNGDDEKELILMEQSYTVPLMSNLTISRIIDKDKRELILETKKLWNFKELIVGDLDNDGVNEIIVYGNSPTSSNKEAKILKVIDWNGSSFDQYDIILSGNLGLIADVNNDGKNELVLGTSVMFKDGGDGERTEPKDISIYSWTGEGFKLIETLYMLYGVSKITAGDLNNDGITEIITEEYMGDSTTKSRIDIYQYNPRKKKIKKILSKNNFSEANRENKYPFSLVDLKVVELNDNEYLLTYFNVGDDGEPETKIYGLKAAKSGSYSLTLDDDLSKKTSMTFYKLNQFRMVDINYDGRKDIVAKEGLILRKVPLELFGPAREINW